MSGSVAAWVRRAGLHIGRRGTYLAFLALLYIIVGCALTAPLPLGLTYAVVYEPFVAVMPMSWWSGAWIAIGILCGAAAVWETIRLYAFGAAALLTSAWALGYLYGWMVGMTWFVRGYLSAAIYGAFAAVTLVVSAWRENGR